MEKLVEWDPSEHITTEEEMVCYLEAALAENDPLLIVAALNDIAKAKVMLEATTTNHLMYKKLHQALLPEEHIDFESILKVINALGLQLHASKINTV